MDLYVEHTLETRAFIKLASGFVNKEIPQICSFISKNGFYKLFPVLISENRLQQILVETHLLAPPLKNKLKNIIVYMVNEVYNWLFKNELSDLNEEVIANTLCWSWKGDLDGIKTVKNIKKNDAVSIEKKFELCCQHCLEEEVINLWSELSTEHQKVFISRKDDYYNKYWIYCIKKNRPPPKRMNGIMTALNFGSASARMFFWQKLTFIEKQELFYPCYSEKIIDSCYRFNIELSFEGVPVKDYCFHLLKVCVDHFIWTDKFFPLLDTYKEFLEPLHYYMLYANLDRMLEKYPVKEEIIYMMSELKRIAKDNNKEGQLLRYDHNKKY